MAVSRVDRKSAQATNVSSVSTPSITVSGSNALLLAFSGNSSSTPKDLTSVKFNTTETFVDHYDSGAYRTYYRQHCQYLANPTATSAVVTFTFATTSSEIGVGVSLLNGVDVSGTPVDTPSWTSGIGSNASRTVASATDNLVFAFAYASDTGAYSGYLGSTIDWQQNNIGGYTGAAVAYEAGAASVETGVDWGFGSADYGIMVLDVNQATGGGDTTVAPDSGSLRFTGQTVGVKANLYLSISSGSIYVQGQQVVADKKLDIPIGVGSVQFTGQTVGVRADLSIPVGAGSVTFDGQPVGVTTTAPGVTLVSVDSGAVYFNGQGVLTRIELPPISVGAGSLQFAGQTIGTEVVKLISIGAGYAQFEGQTVGVSAGNVLASIAAGRMDFRGQTLQILGAGGGKSGVARLKASRDVGYIHTNFIRPDAAQIIKDRLGEKIDEENPKDQLYEVLQKDQEQVDILASEVKALERKLARARVDTSKRKTAMKIAALERELSDTKTEIENIAWLVRLLEEDEIILLAITT